MPHNVDAENQTIVFGGSFDPPTLAHVALPEQVRQAIAAETIAYVPAARSPFKLDRRQTDPQHRLAMLRLALADQPHAAILTDELDRAADGRPSYTVDTLEALRHRLPDHVQLRLLIGADQVPTFHQWRDYQRIIALAEPVVMLRPPNTRDSLLAALPDDERSRWATRLVDVEPMAISSSMARERIARNQPIDDLVPPAVAQYIAEHRLYRDATKP